MVCAVDGVRYAIHARQQLKSGISLGKQVTPQDLGCFAGAVIAIIILVEVTLDLPGNDFEQLSVRRISAKFPDHDSAQTVFMGIFKLGADGGFIVISPKCGSVE